MSNSYRVRIGTREIAAMQPNTILWDQEVRGFVARRQFSDIITFSVVYRTKENVQRWQKLERFPILTPHLARQEAIRVLRAKALGQDPAGEKMALRSGMTVAQLCDEYTARENGKKPATIKSDNSRVKLHIKPKLGKLRIASVTGEQVEDFMHSLSRGSAARTVSLLSVMFSYAVKRKLVAVNPCKGLEMPADVKRNRRLSDAEYAQLGAALKGGMIADIFLLLAVTGFRSSVRTAHVGSGYAARSVKPVDQRRAARRPQYVEWVKIAVAETFAFGQCLQLRQQAVSCCPIQTVRLSDVGCQSRL